MNYLRLQLFSLAIAVGLGAFGAHALKEVLAAEQLQVWQTAVLYHFIHALGGVLLACIPAHYIASEKRLTWAQRLLFVGSLFFSGSLYLLSLRYAMGWDFLKWLGPITPLGGVMFMLGWCIAAFSVNTSTRA